MLTTTTIAKPTSNNDATGYDDAINATHDASDAHDAAATTECTDSGFSPPASATSTTTTSAHVPSTIATTSSSAAVYSYDGDSRRCIGHDSRNGSVAAATTAAGPNAATYLSNGYRRHHDQLWPNLAEPSTRLQVAANCRDR